MKPIHVLVIAGTLAVAAVLGLAAVTKTSTLGASTKTTSTTALAARAKKLDAFEASLRRALKSKPPALPKVPAAGAATPVGAAPRVIYRRPAPIVVQRHAYDDDDGYESEHEEGHENGHQDEGDGEHDD